MRSMAKPLFFLAMALLLSYLTIRFIFPLILPFIIAILLSLIIDPMVNFLEKKARISRNLSVATSMLIFIGGVGSLLAVLSVKLVVELVSLSNSFPNYVKIVRLYVQELINDVLNFYGTLPVSVTDYIDNSIHNLTETLNTYISSTIEALLSVLSSIPSVFTILLISLIATFFITRDKRFIINIFLTKMPEPYGKQIFEIIKRISNAFMGYVRAMTILISLTAIQSIIGLTIIGADYAITMGIIIGFFDILPILGPSTVFIPWVVISFVSGNWFFGFKLTILYLIIISIRQVLETKVVSDNLGLYPLLTLIAMYVGLKILGISGLILGPIVLIALQALIQSKIISFNNK